MKKKISLLLLLLLMQSCAVERVNLSPLSDSFSTYSTSSFISSTGKSLSTVGYTSELTNTLSQFPLFGNEKLNREIGGMKQHVSDYVYAVKKDQSSEKTKAYKNFSVSYKKIQHLKEELSIEDTELLNRYLVKIKTNISLIDAITFPDTE